MKKAIIILGMGPGLSLGIAEKFGEQGYAVGMVSRSREKLANYQKYLLSKGIDSFYAPADLGDGEQLISSLRVLSAELGRVDVLAYNAVDYRMKHILEESIDDLTRGFKISVGNALVAVKELLPFLVESRGSVLLTGGGSANYPDPNMGSISLGKAGIKSLAYQLHQALSSQNVYVGTVTVSGLIAADSQSHSPRMIAEQFWKMNSERRQIEIVF